jgi:hypothetical protein
MLIQVLLAMMDGLTSEQASGARHEAGWMSPFTGRGAGGALKVTQSNNGMQRSADTRDFISGKGAARPLMPGVRLLMRNKSFAD